MEMDDVIIVDGGTSAITNPPFHQHSTFMYSSIIIQTHTPSTFWMRHILHVLHGIRQFVKGWMAVHLVVGGVKKRLGVFGRSMDVSGFHDPDADAFVAATIYVAGVFKRHLCIGGVKATDVFVAKSLFGADEYFPEWPVFHNCCRAKFISPQ